MPLTPEQQARIAIDQLLTQPAGACPGLKAATSTPRAASRSASFRSRGARLCRLSPLRRRQGCRGDRGEEGGRHADRRRDPVGDTPRACRRPARVASSAPVPYESTGVETHFTNGLDPEPRARNVFAFHRPEMLADCLSPTPAAGTVAGSGGSTRARPNLPRPRPRHAAAGHGMGRTQTLARPDHRHPQPRKSLAPAPRALIQMATGSGKTFTAISFIYRLIKYAGARRVLFLVDRGNLGRQTKKEFDQYVSPVTTSSSARSTSSSTWQQQPRHDRARRHQHHPAHVQHAQGPRAAGRPRGGIRLGARQPVQGGARSTTTRRSRSRPSTSSSPTKRTAPSTTSGGRCWSTSTPA